jgi:hypothetical protein
MYGDYPQIQVCMLGEDLGGVQQVLHTDGWNQLQDKLFTLVKNFSYKIVPAKNSFQF